MRCIPFYFSFILFCSFIPYPNNAINPQNLNSTPKEVVFDQAENLNFEIVFIQDGKVVHPKKDEDYNQISLKREKFSIWIQFYNDSKNIFYLALPDDQLFKTELTNPLFRQKYFTGGVGAPSVNKQIYDLTISNYPISNFSVLFYDDEGNTFSTFNYIDNNGTIDITDFYFPPSVPIEDSKMDHVFITFTDFSYRVDFDITFDEDH